MMKYRKGLTESHIVLTKENPQVEPRWAQPFTVIKHQPTYKSLSLMPVPP